MMVTPLQSRFAVLSVDDTGDNPRKLLKNLNKKKPENKHPQNVNETKNDPKKKKPEGQPRVSLIMPVSEGLGFFVPEFCFRPI